MLFVVFMIVIWGIALFHRAEHRALPAELAAITPQDAPPAGQRIAGTDWRVVAQTPQRLVIKRAFEPVGRAGKWRYAVPVLALVVMMVWLQSAVLTVCYLGFLYLRWFVLRIEMEKGADRMFHVLIGVHHLYEDKIP